MHRDARQIAREVLARVGARRGYANRELDAAFKRHRDLDSRDRALVTEMVYGTLRRRATLDHYLARFSKVPLAKLERATLDTLRVALYQVLFLDRIPAAAAVNDAVEAVPERAKGFVNGLLRNLVRRRAELTIDRDERPEDEYLATLHSHPEWLVRRWIARYGRERAEAILAANNLPPPVTVRVNSLRTTREALAERLARLGVAVEPSRYLPHALHVAGFADLDRLHRTAGGLFLIQDEAAQAVVLLLDPQPGEAILDVCAAPGGKATYAAERMGDRGEVIAMDIAPDRLRLVRENALRLGLCAVKAVRGDATRPPDALRGRRFDRVLVDAPCSAIGLLRKQPEVRWRRDLADLAGHAAGQRSILEAAARFVRWGGVLVYAVCSPEPEEGEEIVRSFLAGHPEFRLRPAGELLTGPLAPLAGEDGFLHTEAPELRMDGFFAARLERETD